MEEEIAIEVEAVGDLKVVVEKEEVGVIEEMIEEIAEAEITEEVVEAGMIEEVVEEVMVQEVIEAVVTEVEAIVEILVLKEEVVGLAINLQVQVLEVEDVEIKS